MSFVLRLSVAWTTLALAACGPHCLLTGTLVETPQGSRPIESLRVGDRVVSDGGESRVVAVRKHRSAACVEMALGDGTRLRVTGSHPLATAAGWRAARRLRVGDVVRTRDGSARITSVRRIRKTVDVYDLTVAPYESFFADTVLVHNKTLRGPPDREEFFGVWVSSGAHGGYYRLELGSDGTGTLVSVLGRWGPRVSRVKWSLKGHTLSIRAQPLDGSAKAFAMEGTVNSHHIRLESATGSVYSFQREQAWRDMEKRAERAIHELSRR